MHFSICKLCFKNRNISIEPGNYKHAEVCSGVKHSDVCNSLWNSFKNHDRLMGK